MAPRLTAASIATTVSGMFGMNAATRSPGPTPCARSAAAVMATGGAIPAADTAPDLVLAPEDDSVRRGIDIVAEQVLGEIETGVGEPAGARHPVPVDQYAFAPLADHAAERPDERPELLGPIDRPLPKRDW